MRERVSLPGSTARRGGSWLAGDAGVIADITVHVSDERIDTINDGSFGMQWDFDEKRPDAWVLRDKPAIVHNGGGNLAYADGHAGAHRWQDARTILAPRDDALMPGNRDVLWLQQHGTWREPR